MKKRAKIDDARAEGTSRRSANPSAVLCSVDRDLERLQHQGFDCSSLEARYIVERISMHRLGAYLPIVRDNARAVSFVNGQIIEHGDPQLKEVHDLITYDRRVQTVILKYIGVLEGQLRARYARYMSALHGEMALYDPTLFNRQGMYNAAMEAVARELNRRHKRDSSTRNTPIDIAVEYISLGTLSKLYDNTRDREIVDGIAKDFNVNSAKARSWFKTVANVRNICAHFNPYIVRKQIPTTPLPMNGCALSNRSPFYIFPILERMLGSKAAKDYNDANLDYSNRMISDMTAETIGFSRIYMATIMAMGIPRRFIDPSVVTWEGERN